MEIDEARPEVRPNVAVEIVSRVQLRAVFAGLLVGFGVLALLLGLSSAVGLSLFRPTVAHARGVAIGTMIWAVFAVWVSVFCGAATAALVGRSHERKDGLLHALVVWGALASVLGVGLLRLFGGLANNLVRLGMTLAAQAGPGGLSPFGPRQAQEAVAQLAGIASIASWLYFAAIAGGVVAAWAGGLRGLRLESGLPRAKRVRRQPVEAEVPSRPITPTVPQPT